MNAKDGSAQSRTKPLTASKPRSAARAADTADWSNAFVTRSLDELRKTVVARRGRGIGAKPKKVSISIRLSPEVVDYFRGTGDGWQTRVDETLKRYVGRQV